MRKKFGISDEHGVFAYSDVLVPPPILLASYGHDTECCMVLFWLYNLLPSHPPNELCINTWPLLGVQEPAMANQLPALQLSTHMCLHSSCWLLVVMIQNGSGFIIPPISTTLLPDALCMNTSWPFLGVRGLQWLNRCIYCNNQPISASTHVDGCLWASGTKPHGPHLVRPPISIAPSPYAL